MRTLPLLSTALLAAALTMRVTAQTTPAPAAQPEAAAPAATPEAASVINLSDSAAAAAMKGVDSEGKDVLTVDFPDEDIRTIVRHVADLYELNIIIPDTLTGKTTIKLKGVTWRQIFKSVLEPVGYSFVEDGNIIKIVSNASLQLEPASTEMFVLNYAKASDVKPTLDGLIDAAAGGKIVIDVRSNSLFVTERPSRMKKITTIIEQLDRATAQVMIETKFVEVTDGDVRNIGVNWSTLKAYKVGVQPEATYGSTGGQTTTSGNQRTGSNGTDSSTSSEAVQSLGSTTETKGGVATNATTASLTSSVTNTISQVANTAIDQLNAITNDSSISRTASALFSADQFGFVISALNELTRTKVVSNPTILTLNNSEATINVGEEDPIPKYAYNDQRGTFEVSGFDYKSIGINLKVTPQVNALGTIKLSVAPEVSQKNGSVNFGGAGGAEIPIIATRKVQTIVEVPDGYTAGIGGLITSQNTTGSNKVPLLGDIPVIGNLFKNKSKNQTSTNLLIFITAKSVPANGGAVEKVFDPRQIRDMGLQRDELPGYRDGSDPFAPMAPVNPKK